MSPDIGAKTQEERGTEVLNVRTLRIKTATRAYPVKIASFPSTGTFYGKARLRKSKNESKSKNKGMSKKESERSGVSSASLLGHEDICQVSRQQRQR